MDEKFISCLKSTLTFNFSGDCISYLISKGLSIGIVLMSFTLKLPQIISMLKSKSIEGLSYISIYSEIITFLFSCLYSYHKEYPFMTYGESVIILVQNVIILLLCWKYDKDQSSDRKNFFFVAVCMIISYFCLKGNYVNDYMWYLIGSSGIPLVSISRISQIIISFRDKSTGPLSAFTFLMNIAGSVSRIFTSIKETGDIIIIISYVYSSLLSLIILIQIIYYSRKGKEETTKKTQ